LCALFVGGTDTGKSEEGAVNSQLPSVAVLYVTCDDFSRESCQSCVDQDYKRSRVLICDDSKLPKYKTMTADFSVKYSSRCTLITRSTNQGFKAGNVNHAIKNFVTEDWVLLVDADQILSPDYLSQLVSSLPNDTSEIAFIQAAHKAAVDEESSRFQIVLSPEVALYYSRDLAVRESFGFVPLLGHGALVRKSAWESLGGFPELVSEDFAFALEAAKQGQRGMYRDNVVSYEVYPYDFGGFMIRLRKFAGGTAELFRRKALSFLVGPASVVEKWDFGMQLFWYVLMPLVTLNGFLGAYVTHRLWTEGVPYLHPILPYLYTWLMFSLFSLKVSITQDWGTAVKFYFWSTAVYAAAMPLASFSFVKHLFFRPVFRRTPKNGERTRLGFVESSLMILLGLAAITCANQWFSPFSPILAGQGIAYLSYPLYGRLDSNSLLGAVARLLIYVPGFLMLFALYAMWGWGRY
jgi:cellulose synthase/poly-beta-1,6-N-acetylglucosamine synthase-like glycosyltransferase